MSAPAITSSSSRTSSIVRAIGPDDAGERERAAARREVPGRRHAARRGLEPADAAEVRRHANRPAAVAADAARRQTRCNGGGLAAAGSAGRAIEGPWAVRPAVHRVVRLPRHQLLGDVGHAQHDGACRAGRATSGASRSRRARPSGIASPSPTEALRPTSSSDAERDAESGRSALAANPRAAESARSAARASATAPSVSSRHTHSAPDSGPRCARDGRL